MSWTGYDFPVRPSVVPVPALACPQDFVDVGQGLVDVSKKPKSRNIIERGQTISEPRNLIRDMCNLMKEDPELAEDDGIDRAILDTFWSGEKLDDIDTKTREDETENDKGRRVLAELLKKKMRGDSSRKHRTWWEWILFWRLTPREKEVESFRSRFKVAQECARNNCKTSAYDITKTDFSGLLKALEYQKELIRTKTRKTDEKEEYVVNFQAVSDNVKFSREIINKSTDFRNTLGDMILVVLQDGKAILEEQREFEERVRRIASEEYQFYERTCALCGAPI
jgi:hypothetical protein